VNNKKNPIVVGVALIIAAPLSAYCGAAVLALAFGASFNVLFYAIAGTEVVLGALTIVGGIMDAVQKRKSINNS
jgi:hypothetical protein